MPCHLSVFICVFTYTGRCVEKEILQVLKRPQSKKKQCLCRPTVNEKQCGNALVIHSNAEQKTFECTLCNKRFTRSNHLVQHSRIHSGDRLYKCHVCNKAFSHSGHLNRHMRVHTGDKPCKCSLCNKSFCESSGLRKHKRNVHSDRRPYWCPFCVKMFKTNIDLKSHLRIHTDTKPYSCRHCSDRFTWFGQLKRHLLELHNEGTWLVCNICEKKFSHKGHFEIHIRRHEGVKPYVCSHCPKRFCERFQLKTHQLVHSHLSSFDNSLCAEISSRLNDGPCPTEYDTGDWSAQVEPEDLPVVKQEPQVVYCSSC